jgi:hypothetical protein
VYGRDGLAFGLVSRGVNEPRDADPNYRNCERVRIPVAKSARDDRHNALGMTPL